jgi:predicted RNA-binding protein
MCEANAYWTREGSEELIMEAVDTIEPEGDGNWRLVGIFGDQKSIRGRIKGMHLVDHKILFEMTTD